MTDEEHLATSELEGRQPLDVPEQAPKCTPYVKSMLYIKRSGGSVGAWFKENKDSYPMALPMVVCFVYYIVMTFGGVNPFSDTVEAYLEWGGGQCESIYVDGEWWRLLTNIFAHAGIEHIMGNLAAYAFGAVFLKEILSPWKVSSSRAVPCPTSSPRRELCPPPRSCRSWRRWPVPSRLFTTPASSTAMSSPPTSSSTARAWPSSLTSASPPASTSAH